MNFTVALPEEPTGKGELYEYAKVKVMSSPCLKEEARFILHPWELGDEHWQWVIEAPEEEVLAWVWPGEAS